MKKCMVLSLLAVLIALLALLSGCNNTAKTDPPAPSAPTSAPDSEQSEEKFEFPENGVLALMGDGHVEGVIDGKNPSLDGTKLVVVFTFAKEKAGLDLEEATPIHYTFRKSDGSVLEGQAPLDSSVDAIKNDYGYVGVCFDMGFSIDLYDKVSFDLSFKDKSGKEFSVKEKSIFKGICYYGLDGASFDAKLGDKVSTMVAKNMIRQTATVNGTDFSLTIGLNKWAQRTSPEQIVTLSQLFWECYPRMHARFGEAGESPVDVQLNVENEGYEIASASGNSVHLYDGWLADHPSDFDCITHELAHVIQNGWDGSYCEYSGYIERFADACRYIYAFDGGRINDEVWELQTVSSENTRETSVRFLVWMDYTYSTEEVDLLLNFFTVCRSEKYHKDNWKKAWQEILKGTDLEGKDIEVIWKEYESSEFAKLSSKGRNGISQLSKKYPIREKYE